MEVLLAGVFLWIGFRQILSFRRRPKALGADNRRLPLGLPYGVVVAIGLFEIVAALALVVAFGTNQPASVALIAATGLALITLMAAILNVRRHRSAVPSVALFLMALFVIVGQTI
jgi:drug/metabolite transporter (DMT)-like permease